MTTALIPRPGVTFAVDDVTPETEPFPEVRVHRALAATLSGPVESCSDYHGTVLRDAPGQPLLAAVYQAFARHRPLVLSPDAVWLTIAQGVAHHMAIHGEALRPRLVAHAGKLELEFLCYGWVEGSPENPWPEAFASWSARIRGHVGPTVYGTLACDFSTTGPVERAASDVVMMDVFRRYFHYVALCICGIPTVTLEGTPADWRRLADKAAGLRVFEMAWWLDHLLPVCEQFARAAAGDVDVEHWRNICKLRNAYGGHIVNGWVATLFPYLREFPDGPCTRRNPVFETGEGFGTIDSPPGLSRVPFRFGDVATGRARSMEAIGGLVGVRQHPNTGALEPIAGWAVRPTTALDALLERLDDPTHLTAAGVGEVEPGTVLPADVRALLHRTNGVALFAKRGTPSCRLLPLAEMTPLNFDEPVVEAYVYIHRGWVRLAEASDGSWLALSLSGYRRPTGGDGRTRWRYDPTYAPVCVCRPDTLGLPGRNPVIAESFADFLRLMLDADGRLPWLEPGFTPLGYAEEFTPS